MRDADRLDDERPDLARRARLHRDELGVPQDLVLLRPLAEQLEGVPRPEDGDVEPLEEMRHRADVILVPVREEEAADVAGVGLERAPVRGE